MLTDQRWIWLPFFTPTICKYIVGTPLQNLTASADHVPSQEIRDFLAKVHSPQWMIHWYYENQSYCHYCEIWTLACNPTQINAVENEEQLRDILMEGCDVLQEAGYHTPFMLLNSNKRMLWLELFLCIIAFYPLINGRIGWTYWWDEIYRVTWIHPQVSNGDWRTVHKQRHS